MEVVHDDEMMRVYMNAAVGVTPDRPILIDRFLHHATECEADAISDGENCYVPAVMEHIELAGIHSGDSACILPSKNLSPEIVETIKEYTKKIAVEMHYSIQHIYRMHDSALAAVTEILDARSA